MLAGLIAQIYSSNMTLMLRPRSVGRNVPEFAPGAHLPSGDPTILIYGKLGKEVKTGVMTIRIARDSGLDAPAREETNNANSRDNRLQSFLRAILLIRMRDIDTAASHPAANPLLGAYENAAEYVAFLGQIAREYFLGRTIRQGN